MNHISEDQLVLFYYGESAEAAAIENHLSGCEPAAPNSALCSWC
jgi:hypothetical protein